MIEKATSYKTSDGAVHATIEAAQVAEIRILIKDADFNAIGWPDWIVANRDAVVSILKTKKRKPRTTKPKTPTTRRRTSPLRGTHVAQSVDNPAV